MSSLLPPETPSSVTRSVTTTFPTPLKPTAPGTQVSPSIFQKIKDYNFQAVVDRAKYIWNSVCVLCKQNSLTVIVGTLAIALAIVVLVLYKLANKPVPSKNDNAPQPPVTPQQSNATANSVENTPPASETHSDEEADESAGAGVSDETPANQVNEQSTDTRSDTDEVANSGQPSQETPDTTQPKKL